MIPSEVSRTTPKAMYGSASSYACLRRSTCGLVECVGEGQVVLADVLEVVAGVVGELGPALAEVLGGRAGAHQIDVEVVGHSTHEAEARVGPHLVHRRAAFEVFAGSRHDEAHADAVAGGGRGERHRVDEVGSVLQVVQRGQRMGSVGRSRMDGRVIDQLAIDPQRRRLLSQPVEYLLSGPCSHCTLLVSCSIIELMVRMSNDTVAPSQTLDRGLAVLGTRRRRGSPVVGRFDAAEALGLHRSIVYRLLRTLELRRLVERNEDGDYLAGAVPGRAQSCACAARLRVAAAPVLADLCERLQMTAFLVVADDDEAVTVDSVEPTSLDAHVAYRPGTRHPIDRGAPGLALLAGRPAVQRRTRGGHGGSGTWLGAERGRGHRRHGLHRRHRSPTRGRSPSCGWPGTRSTPPPSPRPWSPRPPTSPAASPR